MCLKINKCTPECIKCYPYSWTVSLYCVSTSSVQSLQHPFDWLERIFTFPWENKSFFSLWPHHQLALHCIWLFLCCFSKDLTGLTYVHFHHPCTHSAFSLRSYCILVSVFVLNQLMLLWWTFITTGLSHIYSLSLLCPAPQNNFHTCW